MQEILVSELKPHPMNDYYFDDMEGQKWREFLESVKTSGIIEPIVITQDRTIVSGHQRVRACEELGIDSVNVEVRIYDDEDMIIKDLIETNLRQRGTIGGSMEKTTRISNELQRLYGVRVGKANPKGTKIASSASFGADATLSDVAKTMGVSESKLDRLNRIDSMPDNIKRLVYDGVVTQATALDILSKLSPEEQEQLIQTLPATEKLTRKQVQVYVDRINGLQNQLNVKDQELANAHDENEDLHKQLENQEVRVETRTVIPDDYDTLKAKVENYEKNLQSQRNEYKKLFDDYTESIKRISLYEEQEGIKDFNQKLERDAVLFCSKVSGFLVDVGGYAYIPDHIDLLPQNEKDAYVKSVRQLVAWGVNLIKYFNDEGMIE